MHNIWNLFDSDIINDMKNTKKNMLEKNEWPKEHFVSLIKF